MRDAFRNWWPETVLALAWAAAMAGIASLRKRVIKDRMEQEALRNGVQALLRAELIRSGEKYLTQGWIQIYAKDAFDKSYLSYHALGANGTMDEMHEKVMQLPTVPPGGVTCAT